MTDVTDKYTSMMSCHIPYTTDNSLMCPIGICIEVGVDIWSIEWKAEPDNE